MAQLAGGPGEEPEQQVAKTLGQEGEQEDLHETAHNQCQYLEGALGTQWVHAEMWEGFGNV